MITLAEMPTKCPLCQDVLADSEIGYNKHMKVWHNVDANYRRPVAREKKELIVKRVEARLGQVVIGGFRLLCVDCLGEKKQGTRRYDGAFLCDDCMSIRANSL